LVIGRDPDHVLAESDHLAAGKAVVFSVDGLNPGTYVISCSVQGHPANGMVEDSGLQPVIRRLRR
jgi:uncharacterized cupredoxin-like copper-binding protein